MSLEDRQPEESETDGPEIHRLAFRPWLCSILSSETAISARRFHILLIHTNSRDNLWCFTYRVPSRNYRTYSHSPYSDNNVPYPFPNSHHQKASRVVVNLDPYFANSQSGSYTFQIQGSPYRSIKPAIPSDNLSLKFANINCCF